MHNKLKIIPLFGAFTLFSGSFSHGETIAAWDFSQMALAGTSTVGNPPAFTQTLGANYSDLLYVDQSGLTTPGGPEAAVYGTLYYDGSFGSTNVLVQTQAAAVSAATGSLASATEQMKDGAIFNANSSYIILEGKGQVVTNDLSLQVRSDTQVALVFEAKASAPSSSWQAKFAAQAVTAASISWSVSTDGGSSYVPVGNTQVSNIDQEYVVDFSAAADGQATLYAKAEINGTSITNPLKLDNLGISASAGTAGTFWANSPVDPESGWRNTGEGYPDETGIGWIHDEHWPWIYSFNQGSPSDGDWILIIPEVSDRSGFYAYNADMDMWFWGSSTYGYFYSFTDMDWFSFNF